MNQQAMLRKMRQIQNEMLATQEEINKTEFKETAGGVVSVVILGTKELKSVTIDKDFVVESPEDLEMLSEMITSAAQKAFKKIEAVTEEKMSKFQIPGMGSLF